MEYVDSETGLNIQMKLPPQNIFKESKIFDRYRYFFPSLFQFLLCFFSEKNPNFMEKIKDNISNYSKTSREYSSLISSSNEEKSQKPQKTLQNFSEKDIRRLSRKFNDKSALSLKEMAKNSNEKPKEFVKDSKESYVKTNSKLVLEGSSDEEQIIEEGNDLVDDNVLMASGNNSKKENPVIEAEKVKKIESFF